MSNIITGIVTNGVVVPASPLPEGARVEVSVISDIPGTPALRKNPTPSELRKLSRAERDVILAEAAVLAEEDYRDNKELTGFEAFSEELDDDADEG